MTGKGGKREKRRRAMGGGLLAGSLCVSVGLGRWNLVWCVCSGLTATLSRPLHWALEERDVEEYMEEIRDEERMGQWAASAQVMPV